MIAKRLLIAMSFVNIVACGPLPPINDYVSPPVVQSTAPASIKITVATRADQKLDVAAEVLTLAGRPVIGVPVTFGVTSGTLAAPTATTDDSGIARTIASAAWQNTLSASASGLSTSLQINGVAPQTPTVTPSVPNTPSSPPIISAPTPTVTPAAPAPGPLAVSINANTVIFSGAETQLGVSLPVSGFTPRVVSWNFGDGTSTTVNNFSPRHTYASAGTYTVALDIADDLGRTANATKTISVSATPAPVAPVAPAITVTISCTAVTPLRQSCTATPFFNGAALTSLVSTMQITWGDGVSQPITSAVAKTHDYAARGTYTISISGTLTTGETFSGTATVTL